MNESLTIVIPVYNEARCLKPLAALLDAFLEKSTGITVLFVDDGSTDGSSNLIEEICDSDQRYAYICLERNCGLSTALKAGIDHCHTSLVGYMDADLQTHPSDLNNLLPFATHHELVIGYRINRKDTLTKRLTSHIANAFKRWLLGSDILDTGCPMKIMQTRIARQLIFFDGMHRFIPDMVFLLGGKVKQVPIQHYPRFAGKSKYNFRNRSVGPLIDALMFRWMQKRFIRYKLKESMATYRSKVVVEHKDEI